MNPRSHRFVLCDVLLDNPKATAFDLMEATSFDKNTIYDELKDLIELGFIRTVKTDGSAPGKKIPGFILHPDISEPFKEVIA